VQPQVAKTHTIQLDESTFQQVLQAAYIIQEQNDSQHQTESRIGPAASLAVIAETQELLQSHYDISAAARLIVEQLSKITKARGIAVALVANDQVAYCAAVGTLSALAGQSGAMANGLSEFLRREEGLERGPDVARAQLGGKRDQAPLFFPVYCEGRIAALLQLSPPKAETLQKDEIRSCQVMAGLLGESITRAAEMEWKQTLAAGRATMLEALERLRPQLQRLAAEPVHENADMSAEALPPPEVTAKLSEAMPAINPDLPSDEVLRAALVEPAFAAPATSQGFGSTCGNCGYRFSEGEKFCGRCGNPRAKEVPFAAVSSGNPPAGWNAPQAARFEPAHASVLPDLSAPGVEKPAEELVDTAAAIDGNTALALARQVSESEDADARKPDLRIVPEPEPSDQASPWSSAAKARQWLNSLQPEESGWFSKHGGDVSVAAAALILLLVIFGWSSRPVAHKSSSRTTSQPQLTLFEQLLVGLGMAEVPAAPVPLGNPNVQVWEDLHTGLYYCPGAELYGKTPGGKVTNQRDAQLDQFEPAARKVCE